ncbi:uncharacterized protein BDZ83DRAFT_619821 [Colletotrichum acutatum]|uniref:Uncharacterized protein n=1 Tax=Glomerella acutata TaxID=27357 RepID=A0AAD8XI32_GLOAC|nr:uncharacterized protein BDZ83DRAFT_619821 [Colletotrichum acutatum]KAK1725518.1 hypothetical protein BDZ83DRAFT_619821 [Colletotrichum acutatum]
MYLALPVHTWPCLPWLGAGHTDTALTEPSYYAVLALVLRPVRRRLQCCKLEGRSRFGLINHLACPGAAMHSTCSQNAMFIRDLGGICVVPSPTQQLSCPHLTKASLSQCRVQPGNRDW